MHVHETAPSPYMRRRHSDGSVICTLAAMGRKLLAIAAGAAFVAPAPVQAVTPAACPGDPIDVTQAITGEFDRAQQGSYVLVPFDVPAGTTSVRVKYCHDQPETPLAAQLKHTLDLGLYEARRAPGALWGEREFRGWGGSSRPDVAVTPQGFSSDQQYKDAPKDHVPGRTTRGYLPGPIPAGRWAAELGVAAVVSQAEGDADGKVAWRVEVELKSDPAFAAQPYEPASYDPRPAKGGPGWYQGDLHVHGEHSALGDAPMAEVFGYAFGTAGLDFVTLSDYVTPSGWGEVGRHQGAHPGKLIARSSEVVTYRGHTNNHASLRYVDYRTGPVFERASDGSLTQLRGPRAPTAIFDAVHAGGGWTQVNHPTIFPSETPGFANLCRGCPWDYSDEETRWEKVDSYEVHTGPPGLAGAGPNPFTVTAIEEWDRLRARGFPITAVAVSDSHDAGEPDGPTESPIGTGRTVVFADDLSEEGIRRGVQAGHAYVKLFGAASPDLRLDARAPDGSTAIMGDALPAERADFEARVIGGRGELVVLRDGSPVETVPVGGADFTHRFTATRPGNYRIQVQEGASIQSLSNPITLGAERRAAPAAPRGGGRAATIVLRGTPKRARAGRRVRYRFVVRTRTRRLLPGATVRFGGRRAVSDARGVARMTVRLGKPRLRRAVATAPGYKSGKTRVRVLRARR